MKKALAIALLLLVIGIFPSSVRAEDNITVTIDGEVVIFEQQSPVIVDGRTLVPARGVFEGLGFTPIWCDQTRSATLIREDFEILIVNW